MSSHNLITKIIYIDRDEYHPDDNPLSIEGNPFYFKDIESLDKEERIAFIPEFLNIDIDNISIDLE